MAADKDNTIIATSDIHVAINENNTKLLEALLKSKPDLNIVDGYGRTALNLACIKGNEEIVEILIKTGECNIHIGDTKRDETPLHSAVKNNHYKIVDLLIKHGGTPNITDYLNNTPLHCACSLTIDNKEEIKELVILLLNNRASVSAPNDAGVTSLHCAAKHCPSDIVELLLRRTDAYVNVIDALGRTPLHYAALANRVDNIKLLLDYGAQVDIHDEEGKLPIFYTTCDNIEQILAATKELLVKAKKGDLEKVEECLRCGAAINARGGENSSTPLHYASWKGHLKIVDLLLKNGANPNAFNRGGSRPLDYAIRFQNYEIERMLRGVKH